MLQPHQQRVVAELEELNARLDKLALFIIENPKFKEIDPLEQRRMRRQLAVMLGYSVVLTERIEAF